VVAEVAVLPTVVPVVPAEVVVLGVLEGAVVAVVLLPLAQPYPARATATQRMSQGRAVFIGSSLRQVYRPTPAQANLSLGEGRQELEGRGPPVIPSALTTEGKPTAVRNAVRTTAVTEGSRAQTREWRSSSGSLGLAPSG
jgi:hypothetical protein